MYQCFPVDGFVFQWAGWLFSWYLISLVVAIPVSKLRASPKKGKSTCTNKYSSMPLQPAGVNTTVPSAGARGSHCPNETWGQKLLQWNSLVPTQLTRTSRTCTKMCITSAGYQEGAGVKKLQKSTSVKKALILLRNTLSSSGHPHCWMWSRNSCLLMLLSLVPVWSLLLQTVVPTRGSLPWNETPTMKWWHGIARDAHQQALAVAVLLEEQMERLSHSTGHHCTSSCWHSGSHWCRQSRSSGCQEDPQVTPCDRGTVQGQIQSPSLTR